MYDFIRGLYGKRLNEFFIKTMTPDGRNKIIAVFFKHLSELYASDAMSLRVPVGNFDLIDNKFYFAVAQVLLKKLDLNIRIEKVGVDAEVPEDRYFKLFLVK